MKIRLLTLILLLLTASVVSAQDDCGHGLTCGPVPWALPSYPTLESPTPVSPLVDSNPNPVPTDTPTPTNTSTPTNTPTETNTPTNTNTPTETNTPTNTNTPTSTATPTFTATSSNTPTATSTPSDTPTPLPTATPFFAVDTLSNAVATLDTFMDEDDQEVTDAEGQPVGLTEIENMTTEVSTFFSLVRGFPTIDLFGPFSTLVALMLLYFAVMWLITTIKYALPLMAALFGLLMRLFRFIMEILRTVMEFVPL